MMHNARIVRGRGDGRRIGFPTINFEIPSGMTESYGIYAGLVQLDGAEHPAVFHYGPVPTFDVASPSLEAHILNAPPETLPDSAGFELRGFIREILDFDSIEALSAEISKDIGKARKILGLQ